MYNLKLAAWRGINPCLNDLCFIWVMYCTLDYINMYIVFCGVKYSVFTVGVPTQWYTVIFIVESPTRFSIVECPLLHLKVIYAVL